MQHEIEKLKNDSDYYGDFGKKFLSNSDISTLLNNPQAFGKSREKTVAMVRGSYFHALILEPEKAEQFVIVDASTRNTNIYKDASNGDILLLKSEADEVRSMADAMMSNFDFYDIIRDEHNRYEVPMIGEIFGLQWKSKCDILGSLFIDDIKTTNDLDGFKWSAKKYNYDSQAWVYNQMYGKPMRFLVIESGTNRMGIFEAGDEFLESGKAKALEASEVYKKFFGDRPTHDINQFYKTSVL